MKSPITARSPVLATATAGRRRETGATFAELMIATLILGLTVVGATTSLTQSATVYNYFAEGAHEALMLAQEIHEAAMVLPWDVDPGTPANFGPDVVTFWDLDDQKYAPPRSASYAVVVSHLGWSQDVEIDYVDLANPTVVVDPNTFTGPTQVRLKVKVYQGKTQIDSFEWWMTQPENGA